jgi:uncharacterized membrane protein YqiK
LLIFYEQGNPKKFVVPDLFVVQGVDPRKRRHYKIWEEGKAPDLAIETSSRKTRRNDLETKPKLYARLGIREYFLFDPIQEYLDPPLQGYRLRGRRYVSIKPDNQGRLWSDVLSLRLQFENHELEFYTKTGDRLLTHEEARANAEEQVRRETKARKAEERARQAEERARQAAEELAAREASARKVEAEARKVEAEARKAAEAECARLRQELRRRGKSSDS